MLAPSSGGDIYDLCLKFETCFNITCTGDKYLFYMKIVSANLSEFR